MLKIWEIKAQLIDNVSSIRVVAKNQQKAEDLAIAIFCSRSSRIKIISVKEI